MDDTTRRHWEQIADETIDRAMQAGLAALIRDPDACRELDLPLGDAPHH